MTEDQIPLTDIARFLEDRRGEFKPVRMKLRTFVEREDFTEKSVSFNDRVPHRYELLSESLSDFERGVFCLLRSGIEAVDAGGSLRTYARGQHTILDMLHRINCFSESNAARKGVVYRALLSSIRSQEVALEEAYALVLRGYREASEQS